MCSSDLGPKEINPDTNELFGITFPVITIRDMVRAQIYLLEHLGIDKLLSVTGGSMGGMQVLQFASLYPNKTYSAIPIACSASHSAQNIDRKSTRLNSSHKPISYAVFCLKKKKKSLTTT